jgi:hypothetical protein
MLARTIWSVNRRSGLLLTDQECRSRAFIVPKWLIHREYTTIPLPEDFQSKASTAVNAIS